MCCEKPGKTCWLVVNIKNKIIKILLVYNFATFLVPSQLKRKSDVQEPKASALKSPSQTTKENVIDSNSTKKQKIANTPGSSKKRETASESIPTEATATATTTPQDQGLSSSTPSSEHATRRGGKRAKIIVPLGNLPYHIIKVPTTTITLLLIYHFLL